LLGRAFAAGEDQPGKNRVAVLSQRIWQSSFGSDTGILGRDLTLDGESYTIIGVLTRDSEFDRGWPEIWLPLAAVGIYGVLSYVTAQRTQELGVRAALGASSWDLIRLVVGGGTVPVAAGLVVGVAGALALTRLFQGLLFETSPTDPVTMVWVGSVLLLVALTACYLPARRAARVDAMTALRYE
jgi:putative ABC transport system permease protein